jgi:lipopolysaccharide cholinephosphotransferase
MNDAVRYPDDRLRGETPLRQAQLVMLRILGVIHDICRRHDISYWLDGGSALGAVRHGGFIPWDDDMDICMLRKDYDTFLAVAEGELPGDLFLQVFGKDQDYCLHWAKIRDDHSTMVEDAYTEARFHKGICVDIFPCDFIPESSLLPRLEKFLAKALRYRSKNMHRGMGFLEKANLVASKIVCAVIPVALEKRLFSMFGRAYGKHRGMVGYGVGTPFDGCYLYDMIFPLEPIRFEGFSTFVPLDAERYLERLYGDFRKLPAPEDRKPHCSQILPATPYQNR